MKSILSALLVMGLSLVAASSFAADSRNVSVINETGYAKCWRAQASRKFSFGRKGARPESRFQSAASSIKRSVSEPFLCREH